LVAHRINAITRRREQIVKRDLKAIFGSIVGTLLTIAILVLGILIGLSLGVLTNGTALVGLWAPAVGSAIGVFGAFMAAMYSQREIEKRELRLPLSDASMQIGRLKTEVSAAANKVRKFRRQQETALGLSGGDILRALHSAREVVTRHRVDPKIPWHISGTIEKAKNTALDHILEAFLQISSSDEWDGERGPSWGTAEDEITQAERVLMNAYLWLKDLRH
jgi:hypothetical protein